MSFRKIIFLFAFVFILSLSVMTAEVQLATSEWPPFEYTEDGVQKGNDVKVIEAVFDKMGMKVEIKFYPWARCVELAKKNQIDGIFTLRKTPEREQFLYFPAEVLSVSENFFFYKKGKQYQFTGVDDLKGLRIGITRGYAYGDELLSSKLFTLDEGMDDATGFKKILADRIDLFACDQLVAFDLLKKNKISDQILFLRIPEDNRKITGG